ncbi:MerR family transcriptional regulator [Evansella cellulosilytica]|uniref:Transcriptional regulator, MerR family n=1 Tax=Evansella cellulosilytica (strain ATCC 21833 / DSM 2522 / FERM P-1141 / JCM 9156 / N-4) TaxID=649639 RepID=E6TZ46_EVAC2|nr:MerR family transcriptional regulator [Evansella cellulosilytica]ADU32489.1 transcriptional regulator, MerR family [Evansella cellulosilytica DSM 2522]
MGGLTIGRIAQLSQVSIETVRYYEKRGLISEATRSESGYRLFTHKTIEDIRFIKSAQALGLTLEEIRQVLMIFYSSEEVETSTMFALAEEKLKQIESKIAQLQHQKHLLKKVLLKSHTPHPILKDQCPVIQSIMKGDHDNSHED